MSLYFEDSREPDDSHPIFMKYHKCKTDGCETTMSEGSPELCPKCQTSKEPSRIAAAEIAERYSWMFGKPRYWMENETELLTAVIRMAFYPSPVPPHDSQVDDIVFDPTRDTKDAYGIADKGIRDRMETSGLIDIFKSSTAAREKDFEIGQRAMLERAERAEAALSEFLEAETASKSQFTPVEIKRLDNAMDRAIALLRGVGKL